MNWNEPREMHTFRIGWTRCSLSIVERESDARQYLERWKLVPPEPRVKTPSQIKLAAEFQRRRRRWLFVRYPSVVLALGGVCIGMEFGNRLPSIILLWVVWIAAILGFLGTTLAADFTEYKCPRCERVPTGEEGHTLSNPEECPTCGLQFK